MIKDIESIINELESLKGSKKQKALSSNVANELNESFSDYFGDRRFKAEIIVASKEFTTIMMSYRNKKYRAIYDEAIDKYKVECKGAV